MARDLGTKYVCFKCGTKFYDLKKPIPSCPKCGVDQREAPVVKPVGTARARASAAAAAAAARDVEELPDVPIPDDEDAEPDEEVEEKEEEV